MWASVPCRSGAGDPTFDRVGPSESNPMPDYLIIRRYGDDRDDQLSDWETHGYNIRVVGDAWHLEGDELKWRVTRVLAGDGTRPPAIVLEPLGE